MAVKWAAGGRPGDSRQQLELADGTLARVGSQLAGTAEDHAGRELTNRQTGRLAGPPDLPIWEPTRSTAAFPLLFSSLFISM